MTVTAVLASLVPILWETGVGSDVMKPIAAPIVGGMITSTIHVLILVPVFFVMIKERGSGMERLVLLLSLMIIRQRARDSQYSIRAQQVDVTPFSWLIRQYFP